MKLNPAERRFTQLRQCPARVFRQFDLVQLPTNEKLRQFPGALAQRAHSRLATVLAQGARSLRKVIAVMLGKTRTAQCATIERRKPASPAHRPEREQPTPHLPEAPP